ncbi:MAG: hypothetical protein IT236_14650 [Bacteroidia bacterium]|nr:hypothetical protein [Bacteroidia bacterium]
MISTKKIISLGLASVFFVACGNHKDHESIHHGTDSTALTAKDTAAITVADTTKFKFDFTLANIPSPGNTIQDLVSYNTGYDKSFLCDYNKVHAYASEQQRSVNLGVYNIDMAFASANHVGVDVLEYTRSIMILVDRLGLGSTVNSMLGKRAEANLTTKDSIFTLIDEIFIKSDSYLRTNKRVHTACNVFLGSWVETIYLNGALYKNIKDAGNKERARKLLWEQRMHLDNIINMFEDFKNEQETAELLKELKEIKKEIAAVKTAEEMTEQKFTEIYEKVNALRTRLTN